MKTTIFALFALAMVLDSTWALSILQCPTLCTKEYQPVCALSLSSGNLKTFSNACMMTLENCEKGCDYQIILDGPCSGRGDDCRYNCLDKYDPICAQSHWTGELKTFPNYCIMLSENCENGGEYHKISDGECSGGGCPNIRLCPHIYIPVCALSPFTGEYKTFGSRCALNAENCQNGEDYQYQYDGECKGIECPSICPTIYSPVCGLSVSTGDLQTFGNSCELNRANCKNNCDYRQILNAACP